MDAEENQNQVSLRAHNLWKSPGDSDIPAAATNGGKVESKTSLPTFPPQPKFLLVEILKPKQGGLKRGATLPPSGSFFD